MGTLRATADPAIAKAASLPLEAIRTTAQLIVDELDTTLLLHALARQAAAVLRCERAMVASIEEGQVVAEVCFWQGQVHPDVQMSIEGTLAEYVARHRQGAFENQPESPAGKKPSFAASLPCRNLLAVPILNHQRALVGLVEFHNRKDRAFFTPGDLELAELFTLQAAVGLERARLYDRLNDWSKSLEMLLAFNAAVNQHLNPEQLIRRLVENATRFLKADGGMAGLAIPLEASEETIMESEAYFHRGKWHERPMRWRRNEGMAGLLLESEFPYLANDYPLDRYGDPAFVEGFNVGRALSVPIKNTEGLVLGFFELHKSASLPAFTWQDAAFLESLGNTTAVSIHNVQLLKALESKNRQIAALSAFNVTILEQERREIARELHDEAGQALIGIKLALQVIGRQIPAGQPGLREQLDQLRLQVNESTSQLKNLARRLRPATLDQLGLGVALAQLATDFSRVSGIPIELDIENLDPAPAQDCAIAVYRIAQEAMTNTGKYAEARSARLALSRTPELLLFEFADDGRGFDPELAVSGADHAGLGLLGMRERASILGGRIEIQSRPGAGTLIKFSAPWRSAPCPGE